MSKKRLATTLAAAVEMSARAPVDQQRSSNTLSEPLRDGGNHDDALLSLKDGSVATEHWMEVRRALRQRLPDAPP